MSRASLWGKVSLLMKNLSYLPKYLKSAARKATLWDYRFGEGKSFDPLFVNWGLTARCNLNCEMCWLDDEEIIYPEYVKEELSTGEVKRIVNDLAEMRPIINFGGGEPFLKEDMFEILSHVKDKGLVCSVITNGTLLGGKEEEVLNTGVDSITFSLDGPQEVHDKIRGEGNFEKTTKVIQNLLEKRKGTTPIIKVNSTISNSNYDKLPETYETVKDLGVDYLRFQHLWFMDERDAESHKSLMRKLFGLDCTGVKGYVSNPSFSLEILQNQIKKVRRRDEIPVGFYPELKGTKLRDYYENPRKTVKNRCLYPWFNGHIKPNGDLLSCFGYILPYKYGNLKENSFEELWNSERAKEFRRNLKDKGPFPGCKRCCGLFEH